MIVEEWMNEDLSGPEICAEAVSRLMASGKLDSMSPDEQATEIAAEVLDTFCLQFVRPTALRKEVAAYDDVSGGLYYLINPLREKR